MNATIGLQLGIRAYGKERGVCALALSGAGDKGERTILLSPLEKREIWYVILSSMTIERNWFEPSASICMFIASIPVAHTFVRVLKIDPVIRVWFRFVTTYVFWFLILLSFRYHLFLFVSRFGRRQYFFGFAFTRLRSTFPKLWIPGKTGIRKQSRWMY